MLLGFVPSILSEAGDFLLGLISFFLLGLKTLVMENVAIKQQKGKKERMDSAGNDILCPIFNYDIKQFESEMISARVLLTLNLNLN